MIGHGSAEHGMLLGPGIELLGPASRYFGWSYVVTGWGGLSFNTDNAHLSQFGDVAFTERVAAALGNEKIKFCSDLKRLLQYHYLLHITPWASCSAGNKSHHWTLSTQICEIVDYFTNMILHYEQATRWPSFLWWISCLYNTVALKLFRNHKSYRFMVCFNWQLLQNWIAN